MNKKLIWSILIIMIFIFTGCSLGKGENKKVSIGSKNFTEEFIIAEMYSLVLEDSGFKVNRKFNLGTTEIAQKAMEKGNIDIYPEYTGTALMTILKKDPISDSNKVYNIVKDGYDFKYKFKWLNQSPMNNTQAIAVNKNIAKKYNLKTLSDLSKVSDKIKMGCPPEFQQREDGIKGLKRVYGGFNFKSLKSYDIGLRYNALKNGEIDCTLAFTTDGQIKSYDLILLEDDKKLWPPYHIAPVVREDALNKNPEIKDKLNKLSSIITDKVMQDLNWKVDGEKKEYKEVAKEFLKQNKLIK